jgi:hypothetical protein
MWKAIGAYSEILTEDLWRQTNAIRAADGLAAPDDRQVAACVAQQREAAGLSRLFAERFARAVPEGGTASTNPAAGPSPAPPADAAAPAEGADTNALPASGGISAETRAQILELAAQAVTAQEQAADLLEQRDAASAAGQRRSHALLEEIARLLPRQESPSREEHTEQKQQQESEQQQAEQPPAEQPPAEQPQPKPEEQEQKEKPPQTPEDVKRMLEKALQREKEHEEEIRERMRDAPSVPVDRDW